MSFDEIPENEHEGYPCDCGGSITKCGNKWCCDSCDFEKPIVTCNQEILEDNEGFLGNYTGNTIP